jgi:hypothetical protein
MAAGRGKAPSRAASVSSDAIAKATSMPVLDHDVAADFDFDLRVTATIFRNH